MSAAANPPERIVQWVLLGMALVVVVASLLLQVAPDGDRVHLGGLPAAQLPPLCTSRALLGTPCPGCGLTRSFVYLAHGDVAASWRAHRLGWLIALLVVAQVPYRLVEIARPRRRPRGAALPRWLLFMLLVAFLGNWVVGLFL